MSDVVIVDKSLEEFKIFVISSCKTASAFLLAWTSSSPRYNKTEISCQAINSIAAKHVCIVMIRSHFFYRAQNPSCVPDQCQLVVVVIAAAAAAAAATVVVVLLDINKNTISTTLGYLPLPKS
jgi:adenosine/AMP kinase